MTLSETRKYIWLIGWVVAIGWVVGCGNSSASKGKIVVRGTVTIDGKAADGVTLSFYAPKASASCAIVTTQADGSYEVMIDSTNGEGNYRVTATKVAIRGGVAKEEGIDEYQLQLAGESANQLPARYADPNTSGLSVALQQGVNEGKNFALKSR